MPTNEAAVCRPASSNVLSTTTAANFPSTRSFFGTKGSAGPTFLGITTTGDPDGEVVERERGLRVVGDDGLEAGVAGGSMPPFAASAEVLPPVEEATLPDLECRLRGGMVLGLDARCEMVGSWSGCTSVVVSSRRSSSIKKASLSASDLGQWKTGLEEEEKLKAQAGKFELCCVGGRVAECQVRIGKVVAGARERKVESKFAIVT